MFGGGDQNTLIHQTGGIADTRDVIPRGRDGEIVQIRTAEDNARTRWRRCEANAHIHAVMQAHALNGHRALDGGFEMHLQLL